MIDTYCSRQKSRIPSKTQALIENDTSYYAKAVKPLVVRVNSFSYKKGIPIDDSGNGGGYVFDCRSTHNPGRYEQFKQLTGLDQPVITFLEEDGEILNFLDSIYKLADFHVQRFIDRGFTNLMFSFGCTGGQHRSVYSAQHLAEHINKKFGIEVHICHREQNIRRILPCR
jgi:RNase adaptor protein for sRNA GlmZ degradation